MPQVNPNDGTTTVDEIIVVRTRTFNGYKIDPPFPADDDGQGPVLPDTPVAPDPPEPLDDDCRKKAAVNRAVTEAASRIGSDTSESGYLLVRLPDGGIRAIGPIDDGEQYDEIPWRLNPSFYGLTDFSNVVGLVHNHPRNPSIGGLDNARTQFSDNDVIVTSRFVAAGVSSEFQQYIVVNNTSYAFDTTATAGSTGTKVEPIQCPGAALS